MSHTKFRVIAASVLIMTLTLGSVSAQSAPSNARPFPALSLPDQARGQQALNALGDKLPQVAAWYGLSPEKFSNIMRLDRAARLDRGGRLFYVDEVVQQSNQGLPDQLSQGNYPYSETFLLHSNPGANRVIYLDFDGHITTGTAWNDSYNVNTINSPPYSTDSDPQFKNSELDIIQNVWRIVAEDYAPFDVDVTTEDPGQAAITRSSSSDQVYGTRAVITDDNFANCGCGGFAYLGVYDFTGDYYKPAFVFNSSQVGVAEAVSHEVGHNLNLNHDGSSSTTYYTGHGSDATGWAAIMGVGYYQPLVQWSRGEYANANNTQNDLAIIQNNGLPLIVDDHGAQISNASAFGTTTDGQTLTLSASGIIADRNDVDVFGFSSGPGDINLDINPADLGANLDISAELYDSNGNLLTSSNPVDDLFASISLPGAAAGDYYLLVDGVGKGDPLVTGYTDYASIGVYTISGSAPDIGGLQAPIANASTATQPNFAPLIVDFSSAGSSDDGQIVSYLWNFGDGSASSSQANPSHSYNVPGQYTVTLTVTDNDSLTDSDTVVVTVFNQPPVAVGIADTSSGEAPLSVQFTGSGSYDPDSAGSIVSYSWSFGDGNGSNSADPNHSYNAAGVYNPTLTVTDDFGDNNLTALAPITVTTPPQPADVITVLQARYRADRNEFKVRATSSEQPNVTLSVYDSGATLIGDMNFKRDKYELKLRPAPDPVPSIITIISSLGGMITVPVVGAPPPATPGQTHSPSPADLATFVSNTPTLGWSSGGNTDSFRVHFGTSANPPQVSSQTGTSYTPGTLLDNTTYYWRVDAVNANGTTTGPQWQFTTAPPPGPPGPVSNPSPADGASNVNINSQLSWAAAFDADQYNVYFGQAPTALLVGTVTGTSFDPGTLSHDANYVWRVDAVNNIGVTTGPSWSFQAQSAVPADTITITKAEWKSRRSELKVEATSSAQPGAVLTVQGFGTMTFSKNKYRYGQKRVANPGTVTVTSDLGGTATATVRLR